MENCLYRCLPILQSSEKETVERCLLNGKLWSTLLRDFTGLSLPERLSEATLYDHIRLYGLMRKAGHTQCRKDLASLLCQFLSLSLPTLEKKKLWKPCHIFMERLEEENWKEENLKKRLISTFYKEGIILPEEISENDLKRYLVEPSLSVLNSSLDRLSSLLPSLNSSSSTDICDSFYILMSISPIRKETPDKYHTLSLSFMNYYGIH